MKANELAEKSNLLKTITLALIKAVRKKKINEKSYFVDSELTPLMSESVNKKVEQEKVLTDDELKEFDKKQKVFEEEKKGFNITRGFGKITWLMNDLSVRAIECPGANKPLVVIRFGQRQLTGISLTEDEIYSIINEFSIRSNIPLVEGVFRAIIDGFMINAVVSSDIGNKFLITRL